MLGLGLVGGTLRRARREAGRNVHKVQVPGRTTKGTAPTTKALVTSVPDATVQTKTASRRLTSGGTGHEGVASAPTESRATETLPGYRRYPATTLPRAVSCGCEAAVQST